MAALRPFAITVVAAVLAAAPWLLSSYLLYHATMAAVWAMAILSVNLLTGFTGQISVATALFVGVGAYTSALLTADGDIPWLVTIPAAGLLTFVLGYVVGVPALRLRGFYLTTLTLAITLAFGPLVKRFDTLTHGAPGVVVPRPTVPGGLPMTSAQWRYLLTLTVATLLLIAARGLARGAIGRALIAIRDGEIVAACNGIPVAHMKMLAFAFSSSFAGIAGAMYVGNVGLVTPDEMSVFLSVDLLAAAVVGGISTVIGAPLGALFLQFVPVYVGELSKTMIGFVFGTILVIVIVLMPGGVVGLATDLLRATRRRANSRLGLSADTGSLRPVRPIAEPASSAQDMADSNGAP